MRKFSIHFPQQPHTLTNRMRFHTQKKNSLPLVTLPLFHPLLVGRRKRILFLPNKKPQTPPPLYHLIPTLSDKTKKKHKTFSFLFLYFFFAGTFPKWKIINTTLAFGVIFSSNSKCTHQCPYIFKKKCSFTNQFFLLFKFSFFSVHCAI